MPARVDSTLSNELRIVCSHRLMQAVPDACRCLQVHRVYEAAAALMWSAVCSMHPVSCWTCLISTQDHKGAQWSARSRHFWRIAKAFGAEWGCHTMTIRRPARVGLYKPRDYAWACSCCVWSRSLFIRLRYSDKPSFSSTCMPAYTF